MNSDELQPASIQNKYANTQEKSGQKGSTPHYPRLTWDTGTAYDLFISLHVLNHPEKFGLRASWAAGVRSRLSAQDRNTLDHAQQLFMVPFSWIHSLPSPKDTNSVLWALRQLPAEQRLPTMALHLDICGGRSELLENVASRGSWDESDFTALKDAYRQEKHETPRVEYLENVLDAWKDTAGFGERFLEALQAYYQVFFGEEEERIAPALRAGLEHAQQLAAQIPLTELLERLSQGVLVQELFDAVELVLAPSYWSTPLIVYGPLDAGRRMVIFGVRPADKSLVPGEVIPDALIRLLKALANPTRLRILHDLSQQPMIPAELSRRLRLRAPTLTHHLRILRLAGLVQLTVDEKKENRYAARLESVYGLGAHLKDFLESE